MQAPLSHLLHGKMLGNSQIIAAVKTICRSRTHFNLATLRPRIIKSVIRAQYNLRGSKVSTSLPSTAVNVPQNYGLG